MDYKALVKTIRDAGDMNAMVDRERLLDSNEHEIELRDDDGCLTWGMVLALCDAVEALEKDRERLDRVAGYERMAQSSRITVICRSVPDVNLFAEMLSSAISRTAASQEQEASTPTPAAPSDA